MNADKEEHNVYMIESIAHSIQSDCVNEAETGTPYQSNLLPLIERPTL